MLELTEGAWLNESLMYGWRQQFEVKKLIHQQTSKFQRIAVIETEKLGHVLVIDDRIQQTTWDEWAYHEMFSHIPIMAHGDVKSVLIIGGGDGCSLKECLKHTDIEDITLVDIDAEVIEVSTKYLKEMNSAAFEPNPRTHIIVDDGTKFVRETNKKFDVIIIDSTDPEEHGPSSVLYKNPFYSDCKKVLRDSRGIILTQSGHPQVESYPKVALSHLAENFAHTTWYQFNVPTYIGGLQAFGWASDDRASLDITVEELTKRWKAKKYQSEALYSSISQGHLCITVLDGRTGPVGPCTCQK